MPLAGGTQAHDKTQGTVWHPALIRVRHDGRVKNGCTFQGVFPGKQGSDKQLAFMREGPLGEHVMLDFFEVCLEQGLDIKMPVIEFLADTAQFAGDFLFRESQGTANDGGDTLSFGWNERADDHSRTLG